MAELIICTGLIWGMCGHTQTYQFPSVEACEKQAAAVSNRPGITYAVCVPVRK